MSASKGLLLGFILANTFLLRQCCSECHQSSALEERMQDWFAQLGNIAGSIGKECRLLPNTGTLSKLEQRVAQLEKQLNKSNEDCKHSNSKLKAKLIVLEGKLKVLEDAVYKLSGQTDLCKSPVVTSEGLSTKIPHGSVSCNGLKRGSKCTITCDNGSYPSGAEVITCQAGGNWDKVLGCCNRVYSCSDIAKYNPNAKSGLYKLWSQNDDEQYNAYCDMDTDNGGWTLTAVIANGDEERWTYTDKDKDYGDADSLWENSLTFGQASLDNSFQTLDYKGPSYREVTANEVLITLKGKPYIQTDRRCLGGHTLKSLLNVFRFCCAGSSYNCYYGKCLAPGAQGVSSLCHHGCQVTKYYQNAAIKGEPLANGQKPQTLYIKAGEAEGAQDNNKDRVYFSTNPFRNNVDYVPGLGSHTALGSKKHSFDIGIRDDVSKPAADKSLYYGIYVR